MENQKISTLRQQVESERAASTNSKVRYSEDLKQQVLALLKTPEWGPTRLSRALGLACSIITRWSTLDRERRRPHNAPKQHSHPEMTKVAIVETPAVDAFELEFPGGARVRGVTLQQLIQLTRGQS